MPAGVPVDPYAGKPVEFVMINNFLIDVSIQEDHTYESEVTDYPMESGGSISDNIRPKPITVTMQGIVSNTPLGGITADRTGDVHSAQGSITVLERAAYYLLKQIWIDREPVTIRTSLNTFENMAMTSLTIPRSKETGSALHFTASFQQIQVVTNVRTKVRVAVPIGSGAEEFGGLVSIERPIRQILWLKGSPNPGDSYTPFSEIVVLIDKQTKLPPGKNGPQFDNKFELVYAHNNQFVRAGTDSPQQSGHTPLTPAELRAFRKDQARDEGERIANRALGRTPDSGRLVEFSDGRSSRVFDSNGNMRAFTTRRPVTNLSDQSRKTAVVDHNDIGKGQQVPGGGYASPALPGGSTSGPGRGFGSGNFPGGF